MSRRLGAVQLPGKPLLGRILLAGWTVAVAAGVVAVACGATSGAAVDVAAQHLGSALLNREHRLVLTVGKRGAKTRPVGGSVTAEDLAERGHCIPAESVSSTPLASSSALRVRWV